MASVQSMTLIDTGAESLKQQAKQQLVQHAESYSIQSQRFRDSNKTIKAMTPY